MTFSKNSYTKAEIANVNVSQTKKPNIEVEKFVLTNSRIVKCDKYRLYEYIDIFLTSTTR